MLHIQSRNQMIKKSPRTNSSIRYQFVQNILDTMTDLVYIINDNRDIEYINPAMKNAFGPINCKKCHIYMAELSKPCPWCRNEEVVSGKTLRWEWQCVKTNKIYDVIETPLKHPDGHVSKLKIMRDITHIKSWEEELQKERDILKNIMENTHAMMAYLDKDFNFIHVNSIYAQNSCHTVEELIGKNHFDLFPNDENHKIFNRVRDTGKPVEFFDKPFEFADQPERGITYWNWSLHPVKDNLGKTSGFVLTLEETSDRKRFEQQIENIAKFPSENPNPVMRIAFDGTLLYANQSSKIFLETWNLCIGRQIPAFLRNQLKTVIRTLKSNQIEIKIEHQIFLFETVPLKSEKYMNLYGMEITDRKRIEDELKDSEARYKLAQKTARIGTWDWDIKTGGLIWSDEIEPLFGLKKGEFKNRYNDFVNSIHPDDRERVLEAIDRCIEAGENYDVQHRVVLPDGSVHWLREIGDVIRNENQVALRMLGVVQDITQQKEARELLENTKDGLERRVRKRTEELENLNVILKKEIAERITYQEELHFLASRLSRMEEQERRRIATGLHDRIVQSLALAKIKLESTIDNHAAQNIREPLEEIRELVDQNIDEIRSLTFEISPPILYEMGLIPAIEWFTGRFTKKHNLNIDIKDDGQPKPLDDNVRNILFQAVCELINNIQKHAKAKRASIKISRGQNQIIIQIEDDGIGFDQKKIKPDMSRLTRFGLFNIKEKLKYLNGQFEIESRQNQGTYIALKAPLEYNDGKDRFDEDKNHTG